MDVIKVNKELFEAFNLLKDIEDTSLDFSKECIIKSKINKTFTLELEILNEYPFDDFIRALVVGFELEETREEKLKRIYETHNNHYAYGAGIKKAVEVLGFEIEGINV